MSTQQVINTIIGASGLLTLIALLVVSSKANWKGRNILNNNKEK